MSWSSSSSAPERPIETSWRIWDTSCNTDLGAVVDRCRSYTPVSIEPCARDSWVISQIFLLLGRVGRLNPGLGTVLEPSGAYLLSLFWSLDLAKKREIQSVTWARNLSKKSEATIGLQQQILITLNYYDLLLRIVFYGKLWPPTSRAYFGPIDDVSCSRTYSVGRTFLTLFSRVRFLLFRCVDFHRTRLKKNGSTTVHKHIMRWRLFVSVSFLSIW